MLEMRGSHMPLAGGLWEESAAIRNCSHFAHPTPQLLPSDCREQPWECDKPPSSLCRAKAQRQNTMGNNLSLSLRLLPPYLEKLLIANSYFLLKNVRETFLDRLI